MIVVFRIGRAGNQMFQFAATQAAKNASERVVYVGFSHLREILQNVEKDGIFLGFADLIKSRFHAIDTALKYLAKLRIIGGIYESESRESLVRIRGIVPLTIFWGGWCQNENLLDVGSIARAMESEPQAKIRKQLPSNQSSSRQKKPTCFVHVRRGDYATFPSEDSSAVLPVNWFLEQMDTIRQRNPESSFLVFSDDTEFAKKSFSREPSTTVVDLPAEESFWLMASCNNGILSPSSFSWWAARVAWEESHGIFIAPDLWAGWNSGDWVPNRHIKSDFLTYCRVQLAD